MRPGSTILPLLLLVLTASVIHYYTPGGSPAAQAAEEKVLDPACGMEIDKSSAIAVEYEGNTYYFCSEMCKAKFEKEPEKLACLCAAGAIPGCKCGHCQEEKAATCNCGSETGGSDHEGEHSH